MYLAAATAQKRRISTPTSPMHPSSSRVNFLSHPRHQINNPVRLPPKAGSNPHRKPAPFTPLPKSRNHRSRATPNRKSRAKKPQNFTFSRLETYATISISPISQKRLHPTHKQQLQSYFYLLSFSTGQIAQKSQPECSPVPAHKLSKFLLAVSRPFSRASKKGRPISCSFCTLTSQFYLPLPTVITARMLPAVSEGAQLYVIINIDISTGVY
ncbi:hypothetical protein HDV62DRAFT_208083 [Trichoderma sp. SZMC 28011]